MFCFVYSISNQSLTFPPSPFLPHPFLPWCHGNLTWKKKKYLLKVNHSGKKLRKLCQKIEDNAIYCRETSRQVSGQIHLWMESKEKKCLIKWYCHLTHVSANRLGFYFKESHWWHQSIQLSDQNRQTKYWNIAAED